MANKLLKELTIAGVTQEIEFPETVQNTVSNFTINPANAPYGGATITLDEGYYYLVIGTCWFGSASSTSLFTYNLWIANVNNPTSPWNGAIAVSSQGAAVPRLNTSFIVKSEQSGTVGVYANINNTGLSGNTATIIAIRLGKIVP